MKERKSADHESCGNSRQPAADAEEALKPVEERVIASLLEYASLAKAAEAVGLHRRTVERTLARPRVQAAYRAARAELMSATALRLRAAAGEAVEVLRDVMTGDTSAAVRVSAARTVLEMAYRAVEQEDVIERLERLESQLLETGAMT